MSKYILIAVYLKPQVPDEALDAELLADLKTSVLEATHNALNEMMTDVDLWVEKTDCEVDPEQN